MISLAQTFKNLLFLNKGTSILFIFLIFLSVLVAFSEIFLVGLVAEFLTQTGSDDFTYLLSIFFSSFSEGMSIIVIACFVLILRLLLIRNTAKITFGLGAKLISYIFNKLIFQKINFFGKDEKSKHIAFLASKVEIIIQSLILPFLNFSSGLIISIIFLIFLSYVSLYLSLMIFFVVILAYGIPIVLSKNILKKVSKTLSKDVATQVHYVKTGFEGFKDLKIWNMEDFFSSQVKISSKNIATAKTISYIWSLVPRSLIEASLFIAVGIFLLLASDFDLFSKNNYIFITFFLALLKVLPSFQQTYYSWQNLRAGYEVSSELDIYFQLKEKNPYKKINNKNFVSLELKNINFFYTEKNIIFNNFSLSILKGEKLAIFGKSGTGKSTLLDLISGIYSPQKGEILFNKSPIDKESINPYIAYISQDPFLFDLSIEENITLSFAKKEEIETKKLKKALIKSGVQEYLDANNLGSDYLVGENGGNLSGGQAQRVAIARALYSGKELILLDEAASSLDVETKEFVINNLLELDESVILITHDEDIYNAFPKKINFNDFQK